MAGVDPWKLMRWAEDQVDELDLSPAKGHVLLVYAVHADLKSGETTIGVDAVCAKTGRGKSVVHDAVKELVALGLLARHRRRHMPSVMCVCAPWLDSDRPEVRPGGDEGLIPTGRKSGPVEAQFRPAGRPYVENGQKNGHTPQAPQRGEVTTDLSRLVSELYVGLQHVNDEDYAEQLGTFVRSFSAQLSCATRAGKRIPRSRELCRGLVPAVGAAA